MTRILSHRLRLVGLALGAIFLAALVMALGLRLTYGDRALPGTKLANIPVGGRSKTEIVRLVAARVRMPLVVVGSGHRFRFHPDDLGYAVDLSRSADRALDAGRTGILGGIPSTLSSLVGGNRAALVAKTDPAKINEAVESVAAVVDRPAFPGRLEISRDTLRVEAVPPKPGIQVAQKPLASSLRVALQQGPPGSIDLPVVQQTTATSAGIQRVATEAAAYLSRPVSLLAAEGRVTISPRQVARILAVRRVPWKRDVKLGVDREALERLIEQIAADLDRRPRDARPLTPPLLGVLDDQGGISWQPRPVKVNVVPSRFGRTVNKRRLLSALDRAVAAGVHEVRVRYRRVEPNIVTGDVRPIDSLIGTFTTYFVSGQPRVKNIQRMAATVDEMIVSPGEKFSLNQAVGRRTRAKGYVPAPYIADGKIVPSVGGGVSQFSTTMYNAVYFAGLPIVAYQPHSIYIDRYPAGRESTLDYPGIDLQWVNDTKVPVLVRATTRPSSVSVSLYGDNEGRRVRSVPGPREAAPGGGFSITVTRFVRFSDGRVESHSHTAHYEKAE